MQGKSTFLERAQQSFEAHGFNRSQLVGYEGGDQGEMAIFALDSLLFRVVRDRSEEFLDVGTADRPDEFHQMDDVALALGWTTVEKILQRTEPEPLGTVLEFLRGRFDLLQRELTGAAAELTRARINRAQTTRTSAFERRLR